MYNRDTCSSLFIGGGILTYTVFMLIERKLKNNSDFAITPCVTCHILLNKEHPSNITPSGKL